MSDNTILNQGSGGDTVRNLGRGAGTVKTQVVQLDLGGPTSNSEVLITAGQQLMAASVPVVLALDQTAISTVDSTSPYRGLSGYFSGVSGAVVIPEGARIVSLSATSSTGGAITILGGSNIVIPTGMAFSDGYSGFVGPGSIVFTGTDSYYVVINK